MRLQGSFQINLQVRSDREMTADSSTPTQTLAMKFLDALEVLDVSIIDELYHDEISIWHNTIGRHEAKQENLQMIAAAAGTSLFRKYSERRIHEFNDGFCVQYLLSSKKADGRVLAVQGCLICLVRHGQIIRLDEYLDSAAFADWRK